MKAGLMIILPAILTVLCGPVLYTGPFAAEAPPEISTTPFKELKIILPARADERQKVLSLLEALGIIIPHKREGSVVVEVSPAQEKRLYQLGIEYRVLRHGILVMGRYNTESVRYER